MIHLFLLFLFQGLIIAGDDFKHFFQNMKNLPEAKLALRDLNIGLTYAQEASEVLAHTDKMFTPSFLEYIRHINATLTVGRSQIQGLRIQIKYYQRHFKDFMTTFRSRCSKFATKWWNEGPQHFADDLQTGFELMSVSKPL